MDSNWIVKWLKCKIRWLQTKTTAKNSTDDSAWMITDQKITLNPADIGKTISRRPIKLWNHWSCPTLLREITKLTLAASTAICDISGRGCHSSMQFRCWKVGKISNWIRVSFMLSKIVALALSGLYSYVKICSKLCGWQGNRDRNNKYWNLWMMCVVRSVYCSLNLVCQPDSVLERQLKPIAWFTVKIESVWHLNPHQNKKNNASQSSLHLLLHIPCPTMFTIRFVVVQFSQYRPQISKLIASCRLWVKNWIKNSKIGKVSSQRIHNKKIGTSQKHVIE